MDSEPIVSPETTTELDREPIASPETTTELDREPIASPEKIPDIQVTTDQKDEHHDYDREYLPETEPLTEDPQTPEIECLNAESRLCYTGHPITRGIGVCRDGVQPCENGKWGICRGQISPTAEICGDGLDNNCNGTVDEGCPCHYLDKPHGVCKDLTRDTSGNCPKPVNYSPTEICGDGLDNNCDSTIDEGPHCATLQCLSLKSGNGTDSDPYLITTPSDLKCIQHNLLAYFALQNDLDMSKYYQYSTSSSTPDNQFMIGKGCNSPFSGTLDGRFFSINGFVYINKNIQEAGLFSCIGNNGMVKDLGLREIYIEGYSIIGGLAGVLDGGNIQQVYVIGRKIYAHFNNAGGIVGWLKNGSIERSFTNISVDAYDNPGGIAGVMINGLISNSYSRGSVNGRGNCSGGLTGHTGQSGSIENSYSSGTVTGTRCSGSSSGGLVCATNNSIGNIINSFSAGSVKHPCVTGGFAAGCHANTNVSNCYWDITRSTQPKSACGTGVNADGSMPHYFFDPANPPLDKWDPKIWYFSKTGYPTLRWVRDIGVFDLVIYYDFEDDFTTNKRLPDRAGHGHYLTPSNGSIAQGSNQPIAGKYGIFSSGSFISVYNPSSTLSDITISLFFFATDPTQNYKIASAAWWAGGNNASGWVLGTHAPEFWSDLNSPIIDTNKCNGAHPGWGFSSSPFKANAWNHVAITHDRQYFRMYINGIKTNQCPSYGDTIGKGQQMQLGAWCASKGMICNGFQFKGHIDEFRIYDGALSDAQLGHLYHITANGNPPLYW
jgi:hypothetical protein